MKKWYGKGISPPNLLSHDHINLAIELSSTLDDLAVQDLGQVNAFHPYWYSCLNHIIHEISTPYLPQKKRKQNQKIHKQDKTVLLHHSSVLNFCQALPHTLPFQSVTESLPKVRR